MPQKFLLSFILAFSLPAFGHSLKGDIHFRRDEVSTHLELIHQFVQASRSAMLLEKEKNDQQFKDFGFGLFYGYKSEFAKLDEAGQRKHIDDLLAKKFGPDPSHWPKNYTYPVVISCIQYVMRYLKFGFLSTGQQHVFEQIDRYMDRNDYDGLALQRALVQLGWNGVYWNQDVNVDHGTQPNNEKKNGARPTWHRWAYNVARTQGHYYQVPISDFLINYLPAKNSSTVAEIHGIERLQLVPFYMGIAHGAYHTFLGHDGNITESHMSYNPEKPDNLEDAPFYPSWDIERYYSGAFVIPPGYWSLLPPWQ